MLIGITQTAFNHHFYYLLELKKVIFRLTTSFKYKKLKSKPFRKKNSSIFQLNIFLRINFSKRQLLFKIFLLIALTMGLILIVKEIIFQENKKTEPFEPRFCYVYDFRINFHRIFLSNEAQLSIFKRHIYSCQTVRLILPLPQKSPFRI